MDMNMDKFSALFAAEKDEPQLVTAVRSLTSLENPEEIVAATTEFAPMWWSGWT
jgi:hypothetical protein